MTVKIKSVNITPWGGTMLFTPDTVKTYEKLKSRHVQDLMHEHPCMAYDHELMIAAAVMSEVNVAIDHISSKPTILDMINDGVIGDENEKEFMQSKLLAAYIAVFEHQAKIYRRYNRLSTNQEDRKVRRIEASESLAIV